MPVVSFDHVAIPTADASRLFQFYRQLGFGILGEEEWKRGERRTCAITFGGQYKINIHPETMVPLRGTYLRGPTAEPGCGDFCFVWEGGITSLFSVLERAGVKPIAGPVSRIGGSRNSTARGVSIYIRDPDENLIEFISYDPEDLANPAWTDAVTAPA